MYTVFTLKISEADLVHLILQQVLGQSDAVSDKLTEENEVLKAQVWLKWQMTGLHERRSQNFV